MFSERSDLQNKFWGVTACLFLMGLGGLAVALYYENSSSEAAYRRLSNEAADLQKITDKLKELEKKINEDPEDHQAGNLEAFSKLLLTHPHRIGSYRRQLGEWGFNIKENCPPGKPALPAPSNFVVTVSIKVTLTPQSPPAFD